MQTQITPTANVVAFLMKGRTMTTPTRPQPTVPNVGTRILMNIDYVQFEDEQGVPRTPMTKIRFNPKTWYWEQVSLAEAGMLVFFDTAPDGALHQGFLITRIVPNGRACYAEPA